MTSWCRKVALMIEFTIRGLMRERMVIVVLVLAILSAAGGWWWRDFNFGENEGRFLLNFGLSVQALGAMVFAVSAIDQLAASRRDSGYFPVLIGRGISYSVIVAGEVIGTLLLVGVFVVGSAMVIAAILWATGWNVPANELFIVSTMHMMKAGVVISFARWFSSYSGNILFIVMAASLLAVIGHLKPCTESVGGLGWVLTRPVPNLAWLSGAGWNGSNLELGSAAAAIFYATGFIVIFIYLGSRSINRSAHD